MASEVVGSKSSQNVYGDSSDESENIEQVTVEAETGAMADEFSVQTWKEDLVLIVEGKRLYIASSVLAFASPVLSFMLETVFKEAGDKTSELKLQGKRYCEFVEFLRCIYPNTIKDISQDNVMAVLPLADEYDVGHLKKKCEQFLIATIGENTTAKDLCVHLNHASKYKLETLQNVCEQMALKIDWKEFQAAEEKTELPLDIKVGLQSKHISSLDDTVVDLTKQLGKLKIRCSELEKVAKSFWVGDSKTSDMPEADIGKVHLRVTTTTKRKSFGSNLVCINGKRCYISSKIVQYGSTDFFQFYIGIMPLSHLHDWSCKINAKLRILNHLERNDHICKSFSFTFTERNTIHEIHHVKYTTLMANEGGFNIDEKIEVEAFLLVDSTVHKAKRSGQDTD